MELKENQYPPRATPAGAPLMKMSNQVVKQARTREEVSVDCWKKKSIFLVLVSVSASLF